MFGGVTNEVRNQTDWSRHLALKANDVRRAARAVHLLDHYQLNHEPLDTEPELPEPDCAAEDDFVTEARDWPRQTLELTTGQPRLGDDTPRLLPASPLLRSVSPGLVFPRLGSPRLRTASTPQNCFSAAQSYFSTIQEWFSTPQNGVTARAEAGFQR